MVSPLKLYLSRQFQATLTLVTTLPKGELSADPDEYVPLCMGLTDLWGAESGDPGPRLLDWRSRWWVVTRVGDLMVAMWVVWPADGGDVC